MLGVRCPVILGETVVSDQEIGKKELERGDLDYFLAEYRHVTGRVLEELSAAERPDFVCRDQKGQIVGVELTRVGNSPPDATDTRVFWGQNSIALDTLLEQIYDAVGRKSRSVLSPDWKTPDANILVLCLVSAVSPSLESWFSDDSLAHDFAGYAFSEIWIADHSTVEAYSTPALYGLFPAEYWGAHPHSKTGEKPYG